MSRALRTAGRNSRTTPSNPGHTRPPPPPNPDPGGTSSILEERRQGAQVLGVESGEALGGEYESRGRVARDDVAKRLPDRRPSPGIDASQVGSEPRRGSAECDHQIPTEERRAETDVGQMTGRPSGKQRLLDRGGTGLVESEMNEALRHARASPDTPRLGSMGRAAWIAVIRSANTAHGSAG